jgi:hypothetical protein
MHRHFAQDDFHSEAVALPAGFLEPPATQGVKGF